MQRKRVAGEWNKKKKLEKTKKQKNKKIRHQAVWRGAVR